MTELKKKQPNTVLVLGAGSWGTALAELLANNGHSVRLWSHRAHQVELLRQNRENQRYLPGFKLNDAITFHHDLSEAFQDDPHILMVVPSLAVESLLQKMQAFSSISGIAWAIKGLEPVSNEFISERVAHYFPHIDMAMLSGPSFAKEVMQRLPTAVAISGTSIEYAESWASQFRNDFFRVYTNDDLIACQVAGAIKNVLAIACGIADGLHLGANTRAAVITRGLAEMTRLGVALGASLQAFSGLAGMGDLVLTCTDNLSRNRRFGLLLGEGKSVEEASNSIGQVVEGMHNASQVIKLAKKYGVELPICQHVAYILHGEMSPKEAVKALLQRAPAKE